jgi:tetratricopeptide (TPR) repeat protein
VIESSKPGLSLLCAVVLMLWFGVARGLAEETRRTEAQRLADAAFVERQKADRLASGWEATYDRGIELAKRAIEVDPSLAEAYYALFVNLGRKSERASVAAQAMHVSELRRLLEKTLELDPKHAHAWEAKGEMLLRLPRLFGGSETEGRQALERSAELDPKWAKPVLRLAQYDWKKGRSEEARTEAEHARELARAAGDEDSMKEAGDLLKEIQAAR